MMIRSLALRIVNAVARHVRPEIRDWPTAMLHEMDFIENDWAALFWAIGSVKLLFKRLEVPMGEPSDILRKAQKLETEIRRRTRVVYVISFGLLVPFVWFFFIFPNLIQRIGSCLIVVSMLFFVYQAYHWRGREMPRVEASTSALTSFYRGELERQCDFHRGLCFWSRLMSMIPGYLLFCIGLVIAHPETKVGIAIVLACFFALATYAVPCNLTRARKYQRQIKELDSLRS